MSYIRKDTGGRRIQPRLPNGKRSSVTFPKGVKAEVVNDYELKLKLEKIDPTLHTGVNPLFIDYATEWLEKVCRVEHSYSYYIRCKNDIRRFLFPEIGGFKLKQLTNFHISQMQRKLREKGYAVQTIANLLSTASSIFKEAVYAGILSNNPVAGIKRLKRQQDEIASWSFVERDRFLEFVRIENYRVFQICAFALCTGLRPMEIRGLCRDCVDFESGFIRVKRQWCTKQNKLVDYTKTRKPRTVPVPRGILDLIRDYKDQPPHVQIFPDFDNSYGIRVIKPLMIKAGVKIVTPHGFRHTFATLFLRKGGNIMDLKELLGHSKLDSTFRYLHHVEGHNQGVTDCLVEEASWISGRPESSNNLIHFQKFGTNLAPSAKNRRQKPISENPVTS